MAPAEMASVTLSKARCRPNVLVRPSVAMTGSEVMLRVEFAGNRVF